MRVLGLDTALLSCAAAVVADGKVLAWRREERLRGHAERLMPMVAEVLADARLAYADLDLIAVTVGPGTFTGLRIGLAAARGLALALNKPLVGVTTLEATAVAVFAARPDLQDAPLAVIHDARRDEVYMELFRQTGEEAGVPVVASLHAAAAFAFDEAAALTPGLSGAVAGTGVHLVRDRLPPGVRVVDDPALAHPDPRIIARLGARQCQRQQGKMEDVRPFYLRPPDAKLPAA